jgi:release factor glutamine methyltransferase
MKKKCFKVHAIFDETAKQLRQAKCDSPHITAGILISTALNCPRLELYLHFNEKITTSQLNTIREWRKRLAAGKPIQYILGTAEFMGHIFKCDPRAIIPRPETEQLVELVLAYKPLWRIDCPSILDIGTGTGCIIISLALNNRNARYFAVDISARAIELARENAHAHGVLNAICFLQVDFTKITFLPQARNIKSGYHASNLFWIPDPGYAGGFAEASQVGNDKPRCSSCHSRPPAVAYAPALRAGESGNPAHQMPSGMDAVVANPPDVSTRDYRRLPRHIRDWEPRLALEGGKDGLQVIKPLIKKAYEILKPKRWLFMEIGTGQWTSVQKLLAEAGFSRSLVHKDLSGRNRIVIAVK